MPVYRPFGNNLIRREDLLSTRASARGISSMDLVDFQDVDVNKPLTIEIRHVYTGANPAGIQLPFFRQDMLVTTAVKSLSSFNEAPRAVNFLVPDVEPFHNLMNPSATEIGTPLIYYSPALIQENSIIDIEITFSRFDDELVQGIGKAFASSAGIPIFAPYSSYLVAAGTITGLAGRIGERLIDGRPTFSETIEISFTRAGTGIPQKGFHIITGDEFDPRTESCTFDVKKGQLLRSDNGKLYDGIHPYVVISLDGTEVEGYKAFAPTAASTAILQKFFNLGENQQQSLDELIEALTLYNDVKYAKQAQILKEQIASTEGEEKEYLMARYNALLKNIVNTRFATRVNGEED